jgi:CubicO group peptidase (beta-lactamase class C family)
MTTNATRRSCRMGIAYVPEVPGGDTITIAQLLEMRSGLYSNTNYALLGLVAERADGGPLATVCRIGCSDQQAAAHAGTLLPIEYTDVNHTFAFGTGGVISTANDLATFFKAYVGGGRLSITAASREHGLLGRGSGNDRAGTGRRGVRRLSQRAIGHESQPNLPSSFAAWIPADRIEAAQLVHSATAEMSGVRQYA